MVPWNVTWAAQPAKWWKADYLVPYCVTCKDACPACVEGQFANHKLDCKDMYAYDESIASRSWKLGEILTIIMAHAQELLPKKMLAINVGAADGFGGRMDPTFDLFAAHPNVSGILLDVQTNEFYFKDWVKRDNMKFFLGPENMPGPLDYGKFLLTHKAPKHLTAVKIDIDSWECTILQNLLDNGYSSVMFHIEFNPTVHLPIRFFPIYTGKEEEEEYDQEIWQMRSEFYGCSLASIADILMPAGYVLLEVDGWDSTWVHNKFASLFQPLPADLSTAWVAGWESRNKPYNNNSIPCLHRDPKLYSAELSRLCHGIAHAVAHQDQVMIDAKMSHIRAHFEKVASHKKVNGSSHPFFLNYTGAHDQHSRCIEQPHLKQDRRLRLGVWSGDMV